MPRSRKGIGGPKTNAGKTVSSLNAMQHGILSRQAVLKNEDPADLQRIATSLHQQLQPDGEFETMLVDRIVSCYWRLARAQRAETALMDNHYAEILATGKGAFTPEQRRQRATIAIISNHNIEYLDRYESAIERRFFRACRELWTAKASRIAGAPVTPGPLHVSLTATGPRRPIAQPESEHGEPGDSAA